MHDVNDIYFNRVIINQPLLLLPRESDTDGVGGPQHKSMKKKTFASNFGNGFASSFFKTFQLLFLLPVQVDSPASPRLSFNIDSM